MSNDDLLDELRRECPGFHEVVDNGTNLVKLDNLDLEALVALIAKREHAAAERMREQRDEARRAAIGYALTGCNEGIFERDECEDVNEWMQEHGVSGLGDVLEGMPPELPEEERHLPTPTEENE